MRSTIQKGCNTVGRVRRVALVFVIGVPGTGKSAVADELKRRGYLARDTDGDSFSEWRNKETGLPVDRHFTAVDRNQEFNEQFEWITSIEKVAALAAQAEADDVTAFLLGSSSNEDEIWSFASRVFCLVTDDDTLRHRLITRTNNDYGKNDLELGWCLEWNAVVPKQAQNFGAVLIDATPPVDQVVDELLRLTGTV